MQGILILAHGSKREETEKILNSLVEKVKKLAPLYYVSQAFLQFSERNLEKGIEELVGKGAKSIIIMPMFLFDGVHVTEDIPKEIDEIQKKYSDISIHMSRHIGDDDRIAQIILDRVDEVKY